MDWGRWRIRRSLEQKTMHTRSGVQNHSTSRRGTRICEEALDSAERHITFVEDDVWIVSRGRLRRDLQLRIIDLLGFCDERRMCQT